LVNLRHCLEGSLEGTSGGISYVFLLCFTVLLKQLRRLYTSGSIFKCRQCMITAPGIPTACLRVRCTNHLFTRSVHQPLVYKALTNQGGRISILPQKLRP